MTGPAREALLSRAFVTLTDTLVSDFDVIDLLQGLVDTCVEVLDVQAAGLLLKDTTGRLQLIVSTTEDAEFVELVQLDAAAGPCMDSVTTGRSVTVPDIQDSEARWPAFAEAASMRGFRSAHATPMRLRDDVLGAMNLLDSASGALNQPDVAAAQALCDVATIAILAERAARERDRIGARLQSALDSRIVIEQAKGLLAQALGLSMNDAFTLIRAHARANAVTIPAVATELIEHRLSTTRIATALATKRRTNRRI